MLPVVRLEIQQLVKYPALVFFGRHVLFAQAYLEQQLQIRLHEPRLKHDAALQHAHGLRHAILLTAIRIQNKQNVIK